MLYRKLVSLCLILASALPVLAQAGQDGKTIPIAIPDVVPYGQSGNSDDTKQRVELYTNLIMTEVASIPYFQVLERKQANELYSEISYQLLSGGELTEAVSNTKLRGATALLLAGFGELYGKIIITARLVDLQSGRILFASTSYSLPESVPSALKELAQSIREKGSELGKVVSLAEVQRAMKSRSWKEAKRLADAFMRDNPKDPAIQALYQDIAANRAEELYKEAKKSVRLRLFKEARIAIDEALALVPEGRYYAFRDAISTAEVDDQYRQKAEALRREERLQAGQYSSGPFERLKERLDKVSVDETRLGASYSPALSTPDLAIDLYSGDWGLDLGWTSSYSPAGGKSLTDWVWYVGAALRYEGIGGGGMGAYVGAWASPLAAESFRLGPLILTLGLDAGAFFSYGPYAGESYRYGFTAGGTLELALRLGERWGPYVSAKPDWRFYPTDGGRDGPALRLCAGFSL